jgi:hypothetical protein
MSVMDCGLWPWSAESFFCTALMSLARGAQEESRDFKRQFWAMEYTAHLHYRKLPYNGNCATHVMAGKGERVRLMVWSTSPRPLIALELFQHHEPSPISHF